MASARTTASTRESHGRHSRTRSSGAVVGRRRRTDGTHTSAVCERPRCRCTTNPALRTSRCAGMLTLTPSNAGTGNPHSCAASRREMRAPSPQRRNAAAHRSPCATGTRASTNTPRKRRRTSSEARSLRLRPAASASCEVKGNGPNAPSAVRRRSATARRDARCPDDVSAAGEEVVMPPDSRVRCDRAESYPQDLGAWRARPSKRPSLGFRSRPAPPPALNARAWEFRSRPATPWASDARGWEFRSRPAARDRRNAQAWEFRTQRPRSVPNASERTRQQPVPQVIVVGGNVELTASSSSLSTFDTENQQVTMHL